MSNALELLQRLFHVVREPLPLIHQIGDKAYAFIAAIIFMETAFVILPFLPGDSLLIPVGLFCRQGGLNIWVVLLIVPLAAVAGDFVNFHIGKFFGPRLFTETSRGIFKKENLEATRQFYDKHGPRAIVIARFVPIVRQLAPFVAGMEGMQKRRFIPTSILAAFLWVWTCVLVGYSFGQIQAVREHFEEGLCVLFLLMVLGVIIERRIHAKVKARELSAKTAVPPGVEPAE